MEIVPETSLSSDQECDRPPFTTFRKKKKPLSIGTKKLPITNKDKGKGVAVQMEFDFDFEANTTERSVEIIDKLRFNKFQKGGKNLTPLNSPLKRFRKDFPYTKDDLELPKKGRKAAEETGVNNVQESDMLLKDFPFFLGKIDSYNSEGTINEIKRTLTVTQYNLLKSSCFGKFLELEDFHFQIQVVHNILFREVSHSRKDELWVGMNGKIMRFGLDEFAVITGLKCVGSSNMGHVKPVSGGLFDKYFAAYASLTRQTIGVRFVTKNFHSDEDAVKIATLHLLVNFFMGAQTTNLVHRSYIDLIDIDGFNQYPWGKAVYQYTIKHIKGQCIGKEKSADYNQKVNKSRFITYRLRGFSLALQFWFYEICKNANGIVCHPVRPSSVPRILKWKCIGEQHNNKDIKTNFFSSPTDIFTNISPTDKERAILELGELFKYPNQWMRCDAIPTSSYVHIRTDIKSSRLDEICHTQKSIASDLENLKWMFKDFSSRIITTLESIQSAVVGMGNRNNVVKKEEMTVAVKGMGNGNNVVKKEETTIAVKGMGNGNNVVQQEEATVAVKGQEHANVKSVSRGLSLDDIDLPILSTQEYDEIFRSATKETQNRQQQDATPKPYKKRIGSCPLDKDYWTSADMHKAQKFNAWLHNGLLIKHKHTTDGVQYYMSRCGDIQPPFDFNVAKNSTKNWFMRLDTPGNHWDETHVDVVFYYLQKLAMYSNEGVNNRYTTTDVFFDKCITYLYKFHQAPKNHNTKPPLTRSSIIDYIHGYKMLCATSWFDVDQILFPMHIKIAESDAGRWTLGRLSIKDHTFWVYNARQFSEADVMMAVRPYTTMLPLFLEFVGYYKSRPSIQFQAGNCTVKRMNDFHVLLADNLPTPAIGDCGLHMATFAEYFIKNDAFIPGQFHVRPHRTHLACLLWKHAVMKHDIDYSNSEEAPGRLPEHLRAMIAASNTN